MRSVQEKLDEEKEYDMLIETDDHINCDEDSL